VLLTRFQYDITIIQKWLNNLLFIWPPCRKSGKQRGWKDEFSDDCRKLAWAVQTWRASRGI